MCEEHRNTTSRIYVTGDTHRHIDGQKLFDFAEKNPNLTKEDYVIVLGDFGYIWDGSEHEIELRKKINNLNFTTLFILGNHENYDLLEEFEIDVWNGGKIRRIDDSIICLLNGEIFTIDDKKIFVFGGAESIDKENRTPHIDWWEEEVPTYKEMNNAIEVIEDTDQIDFVLTHTCPIEVLEILIGRPRYVKIHFTVERFLSHVASLLFCKKWYFGHFHEDKDVTPIHTVVYDHFHLLK